VTFFLVLPYVGQPGRGGPLWPAGAAAGPRLTWIVAVWAAFATTATLTAAHTPWVVLVPTAVLVGCMAAPAALGRRGPVGVWLADRSLAGWIGAWVALLALVLGLVGALFRGPGWSWVWPWIEGVY
jgi:hypothetical protein